MSAEVIHDWIAPDGYRWQIAGFLGGLGFRVLAPGGTEWRRVDEARELAFMVGDLRREIEALRNKDE